MKDIYNYWFYDEKLSSSGMPTADQMKSVAEAGVQVVINLAPHDVPRSTTWLEKGRCDPGDGKNVESGGFPNLAKFSG